MSRMLWILLLCGVATFLLRWLPLWQARRYGRRVRAASPLVQRWLAGVGPAAIAALLAVSVTGLLGSDPAPVRMVSIALALAVVWVARWMGGGIALPTLAGALAYGLLAHFQPV